MKVIRPSGVSGRVTAPPSKSATIRATAGALLAEGVSEIMNPSFCEDATAALSIAGALGAISTAGKGRILIHGTGGFTRLKTAPACINCGESGLCIRMFPPIASLTGHPLVIGATGSLTIRPVDMVESLTHFGVVCTTTHGRPPVEIEGRLRGAAGYIDASTSSQFLTGLLMALPLCDEDSRVHVRSLASRPYVEMTVAMAKEFGVTIDHDEDMALFTIAGRQQYRAAPVLIEGDWSGASFLFVAAAIAGSVSVEGLNMDSFQADKAILEALDAAGAACHKGEHFVTVENNDLKPFEFDAKDCPDLVPPLVALASHCRGKTTIHGTSRLRHKESDRAGALASQFARMGVSVNVEPDRMDVQGAQPGTAKVDSLGDHRIAMACAVAALGAGGPVAISGPDCVAKSYREFFKDLDSIRSSHE